MVHCPPIGKQCLFVSNRQSMRWNECVVIVVIAGLFRQIWIEVIVIGRMILGLIVGATNATILAMRAIDAHARLHPAVMGIAAAALMFLEFFVGGAAINSRSGAYRRKTNPVGQFFAGSQYCSVGSVLVVLVQAHRRRCACFRLTAQSDEGKPVTE